MYATNAQAAEARAAREEEIRQQEYQEYLYKESFKGLDTEEAARVGAANAETKAAVKVDVNEDVDQAKIRKAERMKARMAKRMEARKKKKEEAAEEVPF